MSSDKSGIDANDIHTRITAQEDRHGTLERRSFDLEGRTIFVAEDIDESFGSWFQRIMWIFEQENHDPVTVWLNTPGGATGSMWAFYDIVSTTPCKVIVIGHEQVCSAGVLMLACGDERYVTENCVLMSHEGSGFGSSDELRYSEAKDRRKWEDWTMSQWNELMGRHTHHDAAYWRSITGRKAEMWALGAREIILHGIADALWDPHKKLKNRLAKIEG